MRNKLIGYSVACCLVLGVLYLKNKVFNKTRVELDEETVEENNK